MSRIDDALKILAALQLPRGQQNERSALVLLALAGVRPKGLWKDASQPLVRIWDIIGFIREAYKKNYAANTRETIRRQTIHQFEQARLVDRNPNEPSRPTNSGKTVYRLTDQAVTMLRKYGSKSFPQAAKDFLLTFDSLDVAYQCRRESHGIPLTLPAGATVLLSPGEHNHLQVAILEKMGPRFAPGATVLYLGDTAKKHVICEAAELARLSIPITRHDKLPDVVLFDAKRDWLFMIEAVTSHGPVSPKRHQELETMLAGCSTGKVYVSAFLTRGDFRKHAADIAWETEVWIAENPDHMVHFNGAKFLGPYSTNTPSKS